MNKIDLASVQLGSDAEVFLHDVTGRPFPVCGMIGGTKDKPLVLTQDGIAVQEDNVMLEFNTPISSTPEQWVRNLGRSMDYAFAKIPPTFKPVIKATERFDPALLNNPQAKTFGCEPDYNAWTNQRNPRPVPKDATMRSAAAHVHISWGEPDGIEQRIRVIQMADVFVALPFLSNSPDRERRQLYGRAGSFRGKDYGVEHRVLDNTWLDNDMFMKQVWDGYMMALKATNTDFVLTPEIAEKVQDYINNYKVEEGLQLYKTIRDQIFPQEAAKRNKREKRIEEMMLAGAATTYTFKSV